MKKLIDKIRNNSICDNLLWIIPMLFYKITENKQRELVAIIEERKAKAMADTAVVIE